MSHLWIVSGAAQFRRTAHTARQLSHPSCRRKSSILAVPTGFRDDDPLKITSAIESPRKCFADISPMTQRTASMTFDLPQPLGPTMPTRFVGNWKAVGSTKDLKPESLILLSRICDDSCSSNDTQPSRAQLQALCLDLALDTSAMPNL